MTSATTAARASEKLLARRDELTLAITDAVYDEHPELRERYGEIGVTKCREDMRYTIEHLAPAVALGEPQLFARYVAWLVDLLRARSIPAEDVRFSLLATQRVLEEHLSSEEYAEASRSIGAALATAFGARDGDA
jgi:hypothetical protein